MTEIKDKPVAWIDSRRLEFLSAGPFRTAYVFSFGDMEGTEALYSSATVEALKAEIARLKGELSKMISSRWEWDKIALERERAEKAEAQLSALKEETRKVLEPFAAKSKAMDDAALSMGYSPNFDEYKPRTEFTHGHLRAARALADKLGREG